MKAVAKCTEIQSLGHGHFHPCHWALDGWETIKAQRPLEGSQDGVTGSSTRSSSSELQACLPCSSARTFTSLRPRHSPSHLHLDPRSHHQIYHPVTGQKWRVPAGEQLVQPYNYLGQNWRPDQNFVVWFLYSQVGYSQACEATTQPSGRLAQTEQSHTMASAGGVDTEQQNAPRSRGTTQNTATRQQPRTPSCAQEHPGRVPGHLRADAPCVCTAQPSLEPPRYPSTEGGWRKGLLSQRRPSERVTSTPPAVGLHKASAEQKQRLDAEPPAPRFHAHEVSNGQTSGRAGRSACAYGVSDARHPGKSWETGGVSDPPYCSPGGVPGPSSTPGLDSGRCSLC